VTEINPLLQDQPDTVNSDPHGAGWFFRVKLSDTAQLDALLDETQYKNMIAELT
jgi:glycine cleavage system H protein